MSRKFLIAIPLFILTATACAGNAGGGSHDDPGDGYVDVLPEKTGAYLVGARVFAKHPLLAHRQSFECVKWL